MKIVLDANVVVAAFATRGLCESIVELCLDSHEIIVSEHLLDEIHRNLLKKIKLPKKGANQIIAFLRENSSIVRPTPLPSQSCRDPDDVPILGAALAAKADVIVTGDKDLLVLKRFKRIPILTPRQFSQLVHEK
jgi:putative PIN family toxin of toxin-antitoxin system